MGLTDSTWAVEHEGRSIRVTNSWFSSAKLYVDGDCRDINNDLFSVSAVAPLLSASIERAGGGCSVVEVYIVSLVTTQAMICVDGQVVGGDLAGPPPVRESAARAPYRGDSTPERIGRPARQSVRNPPPVGPTGLRRGPVRGTISASTAYYCA